MPFPRWSDPIRSLKALGLAIEQGTHGQINDLSLYLADDDCLVVRAVSRSYYGVQLALHVIKQFGAAHPLLAETRLLVRVDEATLKLVVAHSTNDDALEPMSTCDVECRV